MSTSPPPIRNLFEDYTPHGGAYDELLTDSREIRDHAQSFARRINDLGPAEFGHRWEQAQQLVHENGIAYSGYETPQDKPRQWELDAIPLVISSAEWQHISESLQQRARLLNLVLKDLYRDQTLLRSGVLPPELLYAHPGFRREYHNQQPDADCFLQFYSADLARSPAGEWWVLADRSEAPSGLGYALENRIVISRTLPDIFHQCQVQRLAPFFIAAQKMLRSLAPEHRENPRVVLLSHGPRGQNYFEDAYMARYLGYTLVEGGDLAVRDGQVMLKTLGGLLPVDVILRRQNSEDCDSLELRSKSTLGVAGLTEAVRTGKVAVANVLGSGLVESPAFMAFMPQLCRSVLGEELRMPGVATWWCGQRDAQDHVLKNLGQLVVQPAFRRRGSQIQQPTELNDLPRAELIDRIRANPSAFSAHERVVQSSAPVWGIDLRPARVALRAFLVATAGEYQTMPGALARISHDPLQTSIHQGEGSKDVWVLSEGPVEHVTLLGEVGRSIPLRRSGVELPSRAADNIFWLGRQLERADASARLLRSAANRVIGEMRSTSDVELPILLRCLADQGQIEPAYAIAEMHGKLPAIEQVLPSAIFDTGQPACLRSVVDELFRLGSIVRDRMSQDTWRIIRRIDEGFRPPRWGTTNLSDMLSITDELITDLAAFSGIIVESMTRTQAYRFLELGRRIERALQIISLVKNCFIPMGEAHGPIFETVLEVADSLMTYRSRYLANLQFGAVLDLLLTDETNPRSLAFQFVELAEHVRQLPRERTQPGYSTEQRIAMSLLHSVRMLDIQATAEAHGLGDFDPLEQLTIAWEDQLPRLFEAISHRYLVHSGPAHQLADISPQRTEP